MRFVSSLFITILLCLVTQGWASDYPTLRAEPLDEANKPSYVLSLGVGAGLYAEDIVAQLRPGIHIRLPQTHIGKKSRLFGLDSVSALELDIVAPLHFTLADRGLEDGIWRHTEYDEISEFLALLKRLEYGRQDGPLYIRLGALSDVRIGHGTIIDHLQTHYRYDVRRWGAHMKLQSDVAGGEVLWDDMLDPHLFVAHAWTVPWARREGAARRFGFGLTAAADFSSPTALVYQDEDVIAFDERRHAEVYQTKPTTMLGVSLDAEAADTTRTRLTFYTDVNMMLPHPAMGWHTGVTVGWQSGARSLFTLQGEFILRQNDYLPGYFRRAYDVSRTRIAAPNIAPIPLAAYRDAQETGVLIRGYKFVGRWQQSKVGDVEFGIEGGTGDLDESIFAQYRSPRYYPIQAALRYEVPWIHSWQDFDLWDQASLVAQVQGVVTPWMTVWGTAAHHWRQSVDGDLRPEIALQAGATFYYAVRR